MAYKLWFKGKYGNVSVEVEDLKGSASCTSPRCSKGSDCFDYPGVCEDCGKIHIRYLAHVKQDVADTLLRATKEGIANPVQRTDMEIADLGIALLSSKFKKEMKVGCVCVEQYLKDCGVDERLAERVQEQVRQITTTLQQHAALTAAREEGRIMEAVRRIRIVRTLHERMRAMPYGYGPKLPSNDPDLERRYFATQSLARKDYTEAEERWKRENFGLNPYYIDHEDRQKITDRILNHLGRKLADCEYKLNRYNGKATYVS